MGISEKYQVKEVRDADEVTDEKYENTSYFVYSYHDQMDKVLVYFKSTPDQESDFECTTYSLHYKSANELLLAIKKGTEVEHLKISFFDENFSIRIEDLHFFLNKAYYSYEKEKLLKARNIGSLIDLMDDFLQEYSFNLDHLRYLNPRVKYKNRNFKILKAEMTTVNGQNESIITNWKIYYSYKNGILFSVEQKTKDETRFKKELIRKNGSIFSYKVYWQVDERFSDDKTVIFDTAKDQHSEKGTYFQVGRNRESDYETGIGKNIRLSSSQFELDNRELNRIFQELHVQQMKRTAKDEN
ncbi:uncharacterized protein CHSO_2749 [Chryseobacterium sp. StRB126]|nr:uncharacterized protein CHSO_2749 [Chryseobacterium sp. StRB126]